MSYSLSNYLQDLFKENEELHKKFEGVALSYTDFDLFVQAFANIEGRNNTRRDFIMSFICALAENLGQTVEQTIIDLILNENENEFVTIIQRDIHKSTMISGELPEDIKITFNKKPKKNNKLKKNKPKKKVKKTKKESSKSRVAFDRYDTFVENDDDYCEGH